MICYDSCNAMYMFDDYADGVPIAWARFSLNVLIKAGKTETRGSQCMSCILSKLIHVQMGVWNESNAEYDLPLIL